MSRENVEVVRDAVAAFNQRGWDFLTEFGDPNLVFHEPPEQPGATVFRGLDAVLEGVGRWTEAWAEQHSTAERIIGLGDTVVLLTLERLQGRDGIRLERRSGNVITLKDGRIVDWAAYWTPEDALAAAGLSEQNA